MYGVFFAKAGVGELKNGKAMRWKMDDDYVIERATEMAKSLGGIRASTVYRWLRRFGVEYNQAVRCIYTMQDR